MTSLPPAGARDLAHGVGRGRHVLDADADGDDAEEKDLDGGAGGVPGGTMWGEGGK